MTQSFEDTGKFSKEFADGAVQAFASLARGAQAFAAEARDYSRRFLEAGSTAVERLVSANSLENAIEAQADYLRGSHASFVAEAAKLIELSTEIARDVCKPFETRVGRAK